MLGCGFLPLVIHGAESNRHELSFRIAYGQCDADVVSENDGSNEAQLPNNEHGAANGRNLFQKLC